MIALHAGSIHAGQMTWRKSRGPKISGAEGKRRGDDHVGIGGGIYLAQFAARLRLGGESHNRTVFDDCSTWAGGAE